MSIKTIRDRLEKLEELTLQRPGVAVILPTEDGFIASRGMAKRRGSVPHWARRSNSAPSVKQR